MAWSRKTLTEHIAQSQAWFDGALNDGVNSLRRRMITIQARVLGAVMQHFEAYLDFRAKNLRTATMDEEHLRQEAADYGITPIAAEFATGNVLVSGNIGSVIIEGEILQRADGVQFALDSEITISNNPQSVQISAIEPGMLSNTLENEVLSFIVPIAGVQSSAIVAEGGIFGGTAEESIESLRARISLRKKTPPRGGNDNDHIFWALQLNNVTRAFVHRQWIGEGSVGVSFVYDNRDDIFPTVQEVAQMQAHLETLSPAPIIAAFAPTPKPINPTIHISPDTVLTRAAVIAEWKDLLDQEAKPGATILLSKMREATSVAAGENDNSVNSPNANFTCAAHEMATLGSVTFV